MALGDHPGARPVFGLDSVQLLEVARGLNEGHDMEGNELEAPTDLCLGAVVSPASAQLDMQIMKLKKKVEAGAEFIQTLRRVYGEGGGSGCADNGGDCSG